MPHVEHILFLKLKPHSNEEAKEILASALAMRNITGVLEVSFGPHVLIYSINASAGFTHGARIKLKNEEAMKEYAEHELHEKFGNILIPFMFDSPISLDWIVE